MAKPKSRPVWPVELSHRAKSALQLHFGQNFTKEMVLTLDLKTLNKTLKCGRPTLRNILEWSRHPELDVFLDQKLTKEESAEHQRTMAITYHAIGRFIGSFSFLEYQLRFFLMDKIEIDAKFANAVVTHDFSLLCTAIQEVYRQTTEAEVYDRLKKLISRVREFNDLRVKVVHGTWFPYREGGTLLHVSRQSLQDQYTDEMAEYLEEQSELMMGINSELMTIFLC
jgi:hypothetical protein